MIYIPKISPIPFKQVVNTNNKAPDVGGKFQDVDYLDYCIEFPVGHTVKFTFQSDILDPIVTAGDTVVPITNITPTGWSGTGLYVFEASYTFIDEDYFIFSIVYGLYVFKSPTISPISDPDHLVRFDFKNSSSDYGYIDTGEYMTVFLEAEYRELVLGNDKVSYQNDRGELTALKSTPIESYVLNVQRSPRETGNMLNMIFSCDDILINSQPFQTSEVPEAAIIETSNLFDFSVTIQRIEDDYNFFTIPMGDIPDYSLANNGSFLVNNGNFLINTTL